MTRTYRVGIVGCGGMSGRPPSPAEQPLIGPEMPHGHAPAYAHVGCTRVVTVCDLIAERAQEFARGWQEIWQPIKPYTDHREMLAREQLDIVSVVTSDHRHADLVVDAAEAGVRGIFCEKPIATGLADADRMIEAVERNGVHLTIGHSRRWGPIFHEAREMIRAGKLGEVGCVRCSFSGPRAMLFRNGTHMIDTICFLADSEPEWVMAELDPGYEDYTEYRGDGGHDPATEPGGIAYIHFQNGVRAIYQGPKGYVSRMGWEVLGTEASLWIECSGEALALYTPAAGRLNLAKHCVYPKQHLWSDTVAAVKELVQLLERGGRGVSDGREARKTLEIMVGMLESQRRGNVRVELSQWRMTSDETPNDE